MEFPSYVSVAWLVGGGFIAGFINTVAGGGSAVSLPILLEVLSSATLANGSNRVAILLQNVVSLRRFHAGGKVEWRSVWPIVPFAVAGGLGGAWLATITSAAVMKKVFAVVICLVALSVLVNPAAWERSRNTQNRVLQYLVFFAVGFYGGFVQAGVGFLLAAAFVFVGGLDLLRANAGKVVVVFCFTLVALPMFAWRQQVNWSVGLTLAVGNMLGAYVGANLAIKKGVPLLRAALVIAALIVGVRLLLS